MATVDIGRQMEVHRLAVAGGETRIARDTGHRLGRVLLPLSRFAEVQAIATATLTLGPDAGAFYQRGWARHATGRPRPALEDFQSALNLFRQADNRGDEAPTLNNIGLVYNGLGDRRQALDHYQQALPIAREIGNRSGEAAALNNIGGVYFGLGDRRRALDYYQLALPIQREVGDRVTEAVTRYNIAMIHRDGGKLNLAVAELERVVDLDRQVEHPDLADDTAMLEQVRQELAQTHTET
ncbi:tetratricopeptide repeat protein [Actinoplanes sp. NEAU-H7]|uniref:Tetratricopeptide repeat protein n=2 Tax=Actinoplanes flavus TaxID=2820290 RepID=A0ABS3UZF3_9ACTN|nr:tetratricopeptide repeat protein [Actinoplanes flavus]